jgi:hypothetical protein
LQRGYGAVNKVAEGIRDVAGPCGLRIYGVVKGKGGVEGIAAF